MVQISDIVVRLRGFGYAGDSGVPEPQEKTLKILGLTAEDLNSFWPIWESKFYELRFFTEEMREAMLEEDPSHQ